MRGAKKRREARKKGARREKKARGAKKRREARRKGARREKRREKKARGAKKRREARRKGARREEKARGAKIRLSLYNYDSVELSILLTFWQSNFENTSCIKGQNQSERLCKSREICISIQTPSRSLFLLGFLHEFLMSFTNTFITLPTVEQLYNSTLKARCPCQVLGKILIDRATILDSK